MSLLTDAIKIRAIMETNRLHRQAEIRAELEQIPKNAVLGKLKCHDCGAPIVDYVMESRSIGGDYFGHIDYAEFPVHVNRRECSEYKAKTIEAAKRAADPFYDVPAC